MRGCFFTVLLYLVLCLFFFFFFSSRRRHTRCSHDWSSDVCSSDLGACPALQTKTCAPFSCGPAACNGNCSADSDCANGTWCSAGVCVPLLAPGQACGGANQCGSQHCVDGVCCDTACARQCEACAERGSVGTRTPRARGPRQAPAPCPSPRSGLPGIACGGATQCASGQCVDGVCCATACTGQCQACDVPGSAGTCTNVIGAPHGARQACASDGSACGGVCDGSSATACAYPAAETSCRGASCAAGVATLQAACDGAGRCPRRQTQGCSPYLCGPQACLGNCTSEVDCVSGNFCAAGICTLLLANGDRCAGASQCASGQCGDGLCR